MMKNGLMHCDKCGAPVQKRIKIGMEERVVGVMCPCREAEAERLRREIEINSRYTRIMSTAPLYDAEPEASYCDRRVKRYIDQWPRMLRENIGLLLHGGVGTGKSASAASICQALRRRKTPCLMSNFATLVDIGGVPRLSGFDLVVFDDLGAERQSEYMLEGVYRLVSDRIRVKKPMVITTNMSLGDMKTAADIAHRRLFDRILSVCVPVKFEGESYREVQRKEVLAAAREAL